MAPFIKKEFVKKAFEVAQRSLDDHIPVELLAEETGINKGSISLTRLLIMHGSADEIKRVKSGEIGLTTVGLALRARLPPETRKILRNRSTPWTAKRKAATRSDGELWTALYTATKQLAGLPNVKDMIRIVNGNSRRKTSMGHAETASNWLKEFMDEWNKHQQLKSEENITNPGNGNAVVGTQHTKPSA